MYIIGAFIFVLGLAGSIALHEWGHMTAARRYNVKVLEFMVGFGPKIWSRRGKETEYGIRALPLGGYIRMIGMYPPKSKYGEIEYAGLSESDRMRTFSQIPAMQKAIIMLAGPFMNLFLVIVLGMVGLLGIGVPSPSLSLGAVPQCFDGSTTCEVGAPAFSAGLKTGDKVIAIDGEKLRSWDDLSSKINESGQKRIILSIERNKKLMEIEVPVALSQSGEGLIGIGPEYTLQRKSIVDVFIYSKTLVQNVAKAIVSFPKKTIDLAGVVFLGNERDPRGPVGVLGLARYSGEVSAASAPWSYRLLDIVSLLASLNASLFVFNLLPLVPLDGGHVLSAIIEGVRRKWAAVKGKVDPGALDGAKLIPLTIIIACFMIFSAAVTFLADVIDPIRLG